MRSQGQEGSGHQQGFNMKDVDVSLGFLGSQGKVLSGCGWVEIAYVSTRQIQYVWGVSWEAAVGALSM